MSALTWNRSSLVAGGDFAKGFLLDLRVLDMTSDENIAELEQITAGSAIAMRSFCNHLIVVRIESPDVGIGIYGFGAALAMILSWSRNGSILYCIGHGIRLVGST